MSMDAVHSVTILVIKLIKYGMVCGGEVPVSADEL